MSAFRIKETMKMAFCLAMTVATLQVLGQATSPSGAQVTSAQLQNVLAWSQVYQISAANLGEAYAKVTQGNLADSRAGTEYLRKQRAFDVLAAALPDVQNPDARIPIVKAILEKREYSPTACAALLGELDRLNASIPEQDELRAGAEATKQHIATLLSHWLGLPDPKLTFNTTISQPGYAAFSAQAKTKAATMTDSSPY
jgi:hypothetical protein